MRLRWFLYGSAATVLALLASALLLALSVPLPNPPVADSLWVAPFDSVAPFVAGRDSMP